VTARRAHAFIAPSARAYAGLLAFSVVVALVTTRRYRQALNWEVAS
jgi:hypothetical protein